MMHRVPQQPSGGAGGFVLFQHFWVETGPEGVADTSEALKHFVTTPSISMHLSNLARAVLLRKYPILLQAISHSRYWFLSATCRFLRLYGPLHGFCRLTAWTYAGREMWANPGCLVSGNGNPWVY